MNILYEDNHVLVVEKPPNVPVQADESGDMDLLNMGKAYIKEKYQKPGAVYLGLVHRLDRPVGGILVLARTSKAAKRLTEDIQKKRWKKQYLAVTEGRPPEDMELEDYLIRDTKTHSSNVTEWKNPAGKWARLTFSCLERRAGLNVLKIDLDTGRHHQIRVQLASRGWPIWGDARYNANSQAGEQIALWAYHMMILHPTKREPMEWINIPKMIDPWNQFALWSEFDNDLK